VTPRLSRAALAVVCGLALIIWLIFMLLPVVIAIGSSFGGSAEIQFPPHHLTLQWYSVFFTSSDWMGALKTSLEVAVVSTVIAVVVGTSLALTASRGRWIPSGFVTNLAIAPLVIPLIVVAVSDYIVFVHVGLVGNLTGLSLAEAALSVPFTFINVGVQLAGMPAHLEEAAQGLGAPRRVVFRRITLPLIMPGILVGALFAFVGAWEEVVVASFLSSARNQTLPVLFWSEVRYYLQPTIGAAAAVIVGGTVLLYAIGWALYRLRGRLARRWSGVTAAPLMKAPRSAEIEV
jgi:putative spermidine/putrescine transport system permease protein